MSDILPDFISMSDSERAEWHEARRGTATSGRVIKRYTRDKADAHLSVRLYPSQLERLKQLSAQEGWTVSALVRRFVEEKLGELIPEVSTLGHAVTTSWEDETDTRTVSSEELTSA